jgi:hypothetical protein
MPSKVTLAGSGAAETPGESSVKASSCRNPDRVFQAEPSPCREAARSPGVLLSAHRQLAEDWELTMEIQYC